jgi:YHS domain-containing protein
MRTTITALCLVVLAASTACCAASRNAQAPAPVAAAASSLRAPGEAQVGDRTTCPVSGEEFVVSATSPWVEHEGKMYYFCCADCAHRFQAEPAKYLQHTGGGQLSGEPAAPTPTPEPEQPSP